jgi:hypothetical protein
MGALKVRCVDNRAYLAEGPDGFLHVGPVEGETTDVTIGRLYEVLWEDEYFYRIVDDMGEDYMYPKYMFERVS